ncbi:carboxylate-amine ligase [Rhodococcus tibetensis]|uniref:Putative glutamate--cysteine ligase 2 n=1 Tax=Rhodococcus tibetensis TaxID=2965064 RepID=A0ABT1Q988_9NOCA|nr:glutamate--cysteine ligase [Rhodococcus sp. FXJ9.536]MCQ4118819.1 glutamate--cysteine ligase [Rhodococcus sp. FXJ9.536]
MGAVARESVRNLTVGVEEEFFLVDTSGHLSNAGPDVVAEVGEDISGLQRELSRPQIETATGVCSTGEEVHEQLRTLRSSLVKVAADRDLLLLPSGTPLMVEERPAAITPTPRYQQMARRFGPIVDSVTTCGCHVHVGIPNREIGVQVSNYLRGWLPVVLALSANSPVHNGRDTGYHSWRHILWSRWPSAGPPPRFDSAEEYEGIVDAMIASGAALDRGMIYWHIRLSDDQPTIEIRIADVAMTAAHASVYAIAAKGLVGWALRCIEEGEAVDSPRIELLRAEQWRAAREGLDGECTSPVSTRTLPIRRQLELLHDSVSHILGAEDRAFLEAGLDSMLRDGTGAERQRAEFERHGSTADVLALLTREVTS